MAHSKSALKRWRQNEAHRARNKPVRTAARTAVRAAHEAVDPASGADAAEAIREAARVLDRAAKRRVIHPNAVSRHKSRMMRHLNRAAQPSASAAGTEKPARPAAKRKAAAKPRATTTRTRTAKAKE